MLRRLVSILGIVIFLSIIVRAFQRQDVAQEGEQSGLITQLQRMFSGDDEEESDRGDVDDSGIARDDTSFAPAGGATDPAGAEDVGNAEETNSGGTGTATNDEQEQERSQRNQRSNRAENDDANLMW
ncbi:MAG: hypothetical protein EA367_13535 [Leptolyngbya sp. DLM2.Bin15]|nr:MAG: hypothetical protein EA367_13535 [Leptolyngbya sp. DLM2.Bin15]